MLGSGVAPGVRRSGAGGAIRREHPTPLHGESAFAVGFQIQGEQASFKVGVTSSGGATGASAGVGFNF